MSQLPAGWAETTLGEICERVEKHNPSDRPNEAFRYIDIGGIEHHRIVEAKELLGREAPSRARQIVRTGDTVLSTVRTYLRKTALVPDLLNGATASTGFCVLRPATGVEPGFVFYRVIEPGFVAGLSALQTGSSYLAVRDPDVLGQRVILPPSNEQRRIVAAIEEQFSCLDAAEESLARVGSRLGSLRTAILTSALHSWLERQIGEISEVYVGTTPSRRSPELWGGGVPWVSSGEVAFCRIRKTRETISPDAVRSPERLHPPGTVLLAMIGEGKTRGQAAILDVAAAHNQNSAAIRLDQSLCAPEWLFDVLMARYEQTRRAGSGAQQPALNRGRVAALKIPLAKV